MKAIYICCFELSKTFTMLCLLCYSCWILYRPMEAVPYALHNYIITTQSENVVRNMGCNTNQETAQNNIKKLQQEIEKDLESKSFIPFTFRDLGIYMAYYDKLCNK